VGVVTEVVIASAICCRSSSFSVAILSACLSFKNVALTYNAAALAFVSINFNLVDDVEEVKGPE